jgi:hypothetical protein
MLFDLNGRAVKLITDDLPDREFVENLVNFHKTIYDCRSRLIDKYIREFNYNASLYFERLNELPIPPLLFFPDVSTDGRAKGVLEQEFSRRNQPLYVIAAHPGKHPEDNVVFAGLTTVDGIEPAVPFAIADLQLAYAYFNNAAFQGKSAFYNPIIDHMYEKTMREISHDNL